MRHPPSDWKGSKDPREACTTCDGEGIVEVLSPFQARNAEFPDMEQHSCEECDGTGVASCEECGADALRAFTVEGKETSFFCSEACQSESGVELDP
jgi:DnaJ-class molecular chaperone